MTLPTDDGARVITDLEITVGLDGHDTDQAVGMPAGEREEVIEQFAALYPFRAR